MLVVDTSVWIDYFKGTLSFSAKLLDREIERTKILVPDLVLAEILRGVPNEPQAHKVATMLSEFEFITVGGKELAIKAATNYRNLRTQGITIRGTVDLLIATWCIENAVPLLHDDRDYTAMAQHLGLQTLMP